MRAWMLATIVLGGLAIFLVVRERSLSNQITSLRQDKDEQAAQQQALNERLDRIEEKLDRRDNFSPSTGAISPSANGDIAQLSKRVAALENQLRSLRGSFMNEYDPTAQAPEPEIDTNAPPKRNWGPEQATGAPDTDRDADMVTAWTALEPDGGPEWLSVGFGKAVGVAQVRIRESYNPGSITKVTTMMNGLEYVLWEGTSSGGKAPRDFVVNVPGHLVANSITIYQDTKRVAGWNEIDAVELIGRDGSHQWANSANASSTYADRSAPVVRSGVELEGFRITPAQ